MQQTFPAAPAGSRQFEQLRFDGFNFEDSFGNKLAEDSSNLAPIVPAFQAVPVTAPRVRSVSREELDSSSQQHSQPNQLSEQDHQSEPATLIRTSGGNLRKRQRVASNKQANPNIDLARPQGDQDGGTPRPRVRTRKRTTVQPRTRDSPSQPDSSREHRPIETPRSLLQKLLTTKGEKIHDDPSSSANLQELNNAVEFVPARPKLEDFNASLEGESRNGGDIESLTKQLKNCKARMDAHLNEIDELENRTRLHIDYAQEKQLEIHGLLMEIEALQNGTARFEEQVEALEKEITNISTELLEQEKKMTETKERDDRKFLDLQNDLLDRENTIQSHVAAIGKERKEKGLLQIQISNLRNQINNLQSVNMEKTKEMDILKEEKENLLKIVRQLAQIGDPEQNFEQTESSPREGRIVELPDNFQIPVMIEGDLKASKLNRADTESVEITDLSEDQHNEGSSTESKGNLDEDSSEETVDISEDIFHEEGEGFVEPSENVDNITEATESSEISTDLSISTEDFQEVDNKEENIGINDKSTTDIAGEVESTDDSSSEKENQEQIFDKEIQQEMETSLLETIRLERQNPGLDVKLQAEAGSAEPLNSQIWNSEIQADMESSLEEAVRNERHNAGLDVFLQDRTIKEGNAQIWSNELRDEMEMSLLEAVRMERQNPGLDIKLQAETATNDQISNKEIRDEMESSLIEAVRMERQNSGLNVRLHEESNSQIWNDEIKNEMEASLLEAVRMERQNSGLNVKLQSETDTDAQIWNDEIKGEMESSLLEAVRMERQNPGLNVKLQPESVLDREFNAQIWNSELRDEMESSLLEAVRMERQNQGLNVNLKSETEAESNSQIWNEELRHEMEASLMEAVGLEQPKSLDVKLNTDSNLFLELSLDDSEALREEREDDAEPEPQAEVEAVEKAHEDASKNVGEETEESYTREERDTPAADLISEDLLTPESLMARRTERAETSVEHLLNHNAFIEPI